MAQPRRFSLSSQKQAAAPRSVSAIAVWLTSRRCRRRPPSEPSRRFAARPRPAHTVADRSTAEESVALDPTSWSGGRRSARALSAADFSRPTFPRVCSSASHASASLGMGLTSCARLCSARLPPSRCRMGAATRPSAALGPGRRRARVRACVSLSIFSAKKSLHKACRYRRQFALISVRC